MQQIKELKNETTLSGIAQTQDTKNNQLLFAVIIDISEPYKTQTSTNFTTKLKLIDPSFNYKQQLDVKNLKFHKFATVYIYSETPESAPRIQNVGDIIRLRRFNFKIGQRNELVGFMLKYSNWLIYSGHLNAENTSSCFKQYDKNKDRPLNEYEKGRLQDLRSWNDTFFFMNSLKYITWWKNCNESSSSTQGVDLILKCQKINYDENKIHFIDQDQKEYEVVLQETPNNIENRVIKLKHVDVQHKKDEPNVIKVNTFSSCLIVPKYFYDARKFLKQAYKEKPDDQVETVVEKFEFLQNYNLENYKKIEHKNLISVVKDSHNDKELISLKLLQQKMEECKKKQPSKYRISVDIIGLLNTKFKDIVKVIDTKDNSVLNLQDVKNDDKDIKDKNLLLNFVFIVKDDSLDANETLYVYLASQNTEDQHLIQTWDIVTKKNDLKEWLNLPQKKQDLLEEYLLKLSNPKYVSEMAVEIVKTKSGKKFLKMIDTIFLPIQLIHQYQLFSVSQKTIVYFIFGGPHFIISQNSSASLQTPDSLSSQKFLTLNFSLSSPQIYFFMTLFGTYKVRQLFSQ